MTTYSRTPAEDRHFELRKLLEQRHPESKELLDELADVHGQVLVESEERAVRHHGQVILSAIAGDLTAWPGCLPQWGPGANPGCDDPEKELRYRRAEIERLEQMVVHGEVPA